MKRNTLGVLMLVALILMSVPVHAVLTFPVTFYQMEAAGGAPVEVSYVIAEGDGTNDDDGHTTGDVTYFPSVASALHGFFIGNVTNVGFRFTNILVPQGATIISATLEFKTNAGAEPVARIYGNDADTAVVFDSGSENIGSFTRTTEFTEYTVLASQDKLSITITDIVQEIVNRGGWASNNSMKFGSIYQSGGVATGVNFIENTGGASDAAILTINYST